MNNFSCSLKNVEFLVLSSNNNGEEVIVYLKYFFCKKEKY